MEAVRIAGLVGGYFWASPATVLGLLAATLALPHGGASLVGGVLEVHGPLIAWLLRHLVPVQGGAAALTLGHVVLGCDPRALDETRSHERVHVRQCERWGPLFLPAYLLASVWAVMLGRNAYLDNWFEVEARRLAPR